MLGTKDNNPADRKESLSLRRCCRNRGDQWRADRGDSRVCAPLPNNTAPQVSNTRERSADRMCSADADPIKADLAGSSLSLASGNTDIFMNGE